MYRDGQSAPIKSQLQLDLWLQSAPKNPEMELQLRLAPRHLLNGAFAWITSDVIGAALILEINFEAVMFYLTNDLSSNQVLRHLYHPHISKFVW